MAEPHRPFDAHQHEIVTQPGPLGAIVRLWQASSAFAMDI